MPPLKLQLGGNIEAAAELYRLVIKQDPSFDPFVAAAHQTHLINTHPWAAGMYGKSALLGVGEPPCDWGRKKVKSSHKTVVAPAAALSGRWVRVSAN